MESAEMLRLVSEATRHRILEALATGESTVTALVERLADEQSNVSHHLAVLRQAGLVACQREGRSQRYRLADPEIARLLTQAKAVAGRMDQVAYSSSLGLHADPAFHGYG